MSAEVAMGPGLFGDEEQRTAERVRALEEQRMLLLAVQEDVQSALLTLTAPPVSLWRSPSAHRYAQQREQLAAEVRQVAWAVDDALAAVRAALSSLQWERR